MLHALALVGSRESAAARQLRLLRALRIIWRRKPGRHVLYALDDDHSRALIAGALARQLHGEEEAGR